MQHFQRLLDVSCKEHRLVFQERPHQRPERVDNTESSALPEARINTKVDHVAAAKVNAQMTKQEIADFKGLERSQNQDAVENSVLHINIVLAHMNRNLAHSRIPAINGEPQVLPNGLVYVPRQSFSIKIDQRTTVFFEKTYSFHRGFDSASSDESVHAQVVRYEVRVPGREQPVELTFEEPVDLNVQNKNSLPVGKRYTVNGAEIVPMNDPDAFVAYVEAIIGIVEKTPAIPLEQAKEANAARDAVRNRILSDLEALKIAN